MKIGAIVILAVMLLGISVSRGIETPTNVRVVTFNEVSLAVNQESILAITIEAKQQFEAFLLAVGYDPAYGQIISVLPMGGEDAFQGVVIGNNDVNSSSNISPDAKKVVAENAAKGYKTALVVGASGEWTYEGTVLAAALVVKGIAPGTTVLDVRIISPMGLIVTNEANQVQESVGSAHKIKLTITE